MQYVPIDLEGLRSFIAVAERLNFNEAATVLGVSPPALTRRVQRLEATLGVPLLERSTRKVSVTTAGLELLHRAREALATLDAAIKATRDEARQRTSHLVLASVPTMTVHLVPQLVSALRRSRPEIHVRVLECGAGTVEQVVRDGTADLGFGFPTGPVERDLVFDRIMHDPYRLVMPAGHSLASRDTVEWQELKCYKVITAGRQSGNMRVLDTALRGVTWRPDTQFEVDHLTTALGLVEAGLGIAVMPRSALPASSSSGLTMRDLVCPKVTRSLGVFRRRAATPSAVLRQLLLLLRQLGPSLGDTDQHP